MTNEELILERLDRIESQLAPLLQTAGSVRELRDDLVPLSAQAFRLLINELEDIESGFQLEDLLEMVKTFLRSVKTITFSLQQLSNLVDFVTTIEPLLRSSVPQIINYLDDLEQRGVLRMFTAMLDVRAKVAAAYTPEDIDKIGDGAVALLGLAKRLSDPQAVAFLEKMAEIPARVDFSQTKDLGPFGLISAASGKEVKQGLGVLMELTKAMGKLKRNGGGDTAAI
jgi:uncharacterized protein YjgD (DUF1641 family)